MKTYIAFRANVLDANTFVQMLDKLQLIFMLLV